MIVSGSTSWRPSTQPTRPSDPVTLTDRVGRLLASALHIDVPAIDTDLFEAGVLDSLGFVELLVQLEREFGLAITVADIEVENFRTIARIAEFVAGFGSRGSPAGPPQRAQRTPRTQGTSHNDA